MPDTDKSQNELADASTDDGAPRVSFFRRFRPLILFLLLAGILFGLFRAFWDYMYVYRIPAGTKVVDKTMVPVRSRLAELIYNSGLIEKLNCGWIRAYEGYRYYVIPDGAEEIGKSAFSHAVYSLRGVRIPGSVKKIDSNAFAGCPLLEEFEIPDGVETIGDGAFATCVHLTSIRIPDSVRVIGSRAFWNDSALRRADIPDTVEKIEYNAFGQCISLEEIRLPAGIAGKASVLGNAVFSGCSELKKVTLPDGIRTLGGSFFHGCSSLSEIDIPDSVTSIGPLAFQGCRSLPPVTLGRQVADVGGGAFAGTGCRLTVPDDHPSLRLEDGILYSKDRSRLISCVSSPDGRYVVAPETSVIRQGAFQGCDVADIRLPEGLEIISDDAFRSCFFGSERIELPDSLKEIGRNAFFGCSGLEEIVIPPNVTDVKQNAFAECGFLKRAVLSENMDTIPRGMFSWCTKLQEVVIPEGIARIEEDAFYSCKNLRRVTLPDSLEFIAPTAFFQCYSLDQETRERVEKLIPRPSRPGYR